MRRCNRPQALGTLLFVAGTFLPAVLGGVASDAGAVFAVAPAIGLIILGALVFLGYCPAR